MGFKEGRYGYRVDFRRTSGFQGALRVEKAPDRLNDHRRVRPIERVEVRLLGTKGKALAVFVDSLIRDEASHTNVVSGAPMSETTSNDAEINVGVRTAERLVYLAEKHPEGANFYVT